MALEVIIEKIDPENPPSTKPLMAVASTGGLGKAPALLGCGFELSRPRSERMRQLCSET